MTETDEEGNIYHYKLIECLDGDIKCFFTKDRFSATKIKWNEKTQLCKKLHATLNSPAIEYVNGDREYHYYGMLHRADGPAIEFADGEDCEYYFYGLMLNFIHNNQEFESWIQSKEAQAQKLVMKNFIIKNFK